MKKTITTTDSKTGVTTSKTKSFQGKFAWFVCFVIALALAIGLGSEAIHAIFG